MQPHRKNSIFLILDAWHIQNKIRGIHCSGGEGSLSPGKEEGAKLRDIPINSSNEMDKLRDIPINSTKEMDIGHQHRAFADGCTQLHYAAAHSNMVTILAILRQGAELLVEDALHRLPMEIAISSKNSKRFFFKKLICNPHSLFASFDGAETVCLQKEHGHIHWLCY
jgi:ankyrin repeat protein